MIGSLETAERRIRELAERYDPALIEQATAELMDYSSDVCAPRSRNFRTVSTQPACSWRTTASPPIRSRYG